MRTRYNGLTTDRRARTMNRLKEFREEAMMTVRELSERSGVSEDTITKIENGHRKGRGMTNRKLARALGIEPDRLFPEDFARTVGGSPEAVVRGNDALAGVLRALGVVKEVEEQSGLGAQAHLKSLTERQREVILAVRDGGALSPSELAERLGCSVSTAYRDLAVLGEYGLVSRDESGESRATALGKGVAGVLGKGGLHYEDALRHITALIRAYEPVAGVEPLRLAEEEAKLFSWLQESVIRLIGQIANAAEPSPLAVHKRESGGESELKREGIQDPATSVLSVMRNLASKPPKITTIRADIEGVPEEHIYEALDAVSAAFRLGYGTADPYKNFVWNLKRPIRSGRFPTS